MFRYFLILVHVTFQAVVDGQVLKAEYLPIKLPTVLVRSAPVYDGLDTIFLLGGLSPFSSHEILAFNIAAETISVVGSFPGRDYGYDTTAQIDGDGNILYFAGYYPGVYKFNPVENTTEEVGRLPYPPARCTTLKYNQDSNIVYFIGGRGNQGKIMLYDMANLTYTEIQQTLEPSFANPTSVQFGNRAVIFGASNEYPYFSLDLYTFQTRIAYKNSTDFPLIAYYANAVFDGGRYAYVVGGFDPNGSIATNGIVQFNLETEEQRFLRVEGFRVEGDKYFFYAPSAVFVPKLKRIYLFGGSLSATQEGYLDDIWYIDLSPIP